MPYADLYRQTKVQEAVYETLTKEYELAKVSEAREIPSVKILDPANVPQEKSYPPRLQMAILGALLGCLLCAGTLGLRFQWDRIDDNDPWKKFARQMFATTKASIIRMRRGDSPVKSWKSAGESDPTTAQ